MVVGYGIIKKEDVVDVFPYTYHGNNIPAGIGWVKKVDNCDNGSNIISVKLTDDACFIITYH